MDSETIQVFFPPVETQVQRFQKFHSCAANCVISSVKMIQRVMTVVYDSYIRAASEHPTEYVNLDIVRKHFGKDAQATFKNGRVQKVFVKTELDGKRILLVYAERDDV